MNEIEATADPPTSPRRVIAGAVVLAVALVVATAVVLVGRTGGANGVGLPALPGASSGAGVPAAAGAPAGASTSLPAQAIASPAGFRLARPLPALATHAPAFRLDQGIDRPAVTKLASALGIHAAVQATASGWTATEGARRLDVSRYAGGTWWYTATSSSCVGVAAVAGTKGGVVCSSANSGNAVAAVVSPPTTATGGRAVVSSPTTATGGTAVVSSPTTAKPAPLPVTTVPTGVGGCNPPPCPPGAMCPMVCLPVSRVPCPCPSPAPTAGLPSSLQAKTAALGLLTASGFDLGGADVNVTADPWAVVVAVDPAIDGLPTTGMGFSVTLGAKDTVEYASGSLGRPTKLGDYPLAGTAAGFTRLQRGQWLFGMGGPMLGVAAVGGGGPQVGAPVPAGGGMPTVAVTGAHLALVHVAGVGQVGYLEPAYVFETTPAGYTPSVPAVIDRLLQVVPAYVPTRGIRQPAPLPGQVVPMPATTCPTPAGLNAPACAPVQPGGPAAGGPTPTYHPLETPAP